MSERDHHDQHYATEATMLFGSAIFRRVHDRVVRDFLHSTALGRSHRMLSLGCGDGAIERRLAPHVGEIVGIDISPVAIERARENALAAGLRNLTFAVSDASDGFPPGPFDCVAAFAFLHHLDDDSIQQTLKVARAVLRHPGGLFYSMDPSCRRVVKLLKGLVRAAYERHHSPDERELHPEMLAAAATRAGLACPAIAYTDYFLGPLAWLAPATPRWLAGALEAADSLALRTPGVRRYASSFSMLARAA